MKISSLALIAILVLSGIFGGVYYVRAHKPTTVDDADNGKLFEDVIEESTQSPANDRQLPATRILQKQRVALSLIRGEISFSNAADRFRDLSQHDPTTLDYLRARYPAATESELWHRQVIGYVRGFSRADSVRVSRLVPLLEAELARRFPNAGGPGVPFHPEPNRMFVPSARIQDVNDPPRRHAKPIARPFQN